jgi:hypothetical protein
MSVRLAHQPELPELARRLASKPMLVGDLERGTELAVQHLQATLEAADVWVLPEGVAYVSPPHQLHAYYFDGVLRAEPLREVMEHYVELSVLIPEYAMPVIQWVQRKLGFQHVATEHPVLWTAKLWPVHRLHWEREKG